MVIDKSFYMGLAIAEAWKYQGLTYPNPAVGCCVVGEKGEILAVNAHQKAGEPHAEVLALRDAYFKLTNNDEILQLQSSFEIHSYLIKNHNNIFHNIFVYTTLEPCAHIGKTPSCASLLSTLKVKKVYVGSRDFHKEASCGNEMMQKVGIEVIENVLKEQCDVLLEPFKKFQTSRFVFFKWAQRLSGTTDGGVISSKDSRVNVHQMRDVCDLLVIGGNTVRLDRPTLDARLVNGKAPDVLIVSRQKEFDTTIPLFQVPNRKVFIADDFSICQNYHNIMIEGSAKMFELSKDIVDMYLCYLAPTFGGLKGFEGIDEKFTILHTRETKEDLILWMKRE
ncbi:Diaminohydroxyphosphoribosylaminopyrimidine deaminase / 5-amino-6-(5-phosphoribosylamino)uracil reductase [hydrothermal vent metagenome]|uniref:5-amino-6-(5-phosphoribosylamino)uracil reductase n=1 Tax=hydrothermal vent metagenome TaxID=652676 RepID=A0A1W1D2D6_9ZZZZ